MIPFHKPRVFRSTTGCCICKTKTSSSRFTDSKKYEEDFMDCFHLIEQRTGQICNACVLLVKRWKKLPDKFDRNWSHVVDARAGPGTKSLSRCRTNKKSKRNPCSPSPIKKKHRYIKKGLGGDEDHALNDEIEPDNPFEDSPLPSPCPSPYPSPYPSPSRALSDEESLSFIQDKTVLTLGSARRKQRNPSQFKPSEFVDLAYWRQENVCCGTVYIGKQGEVMVDPRFFVPCSCRSASKNGLADLGSETPTGLSCSASDGGSHYGDELSEHNLSDDSLDHRLHDSCYSSAANSPSHESTTVMIHHLASDHHS